MNKNAKNVSVILCHEADTLRPAPIGPSSTSDILLVDKKNSSFEVQAVDASGEPLAIPLKDATLCVLTSDPSMIIAEEPSGTTFRLKRAEGGDIGAAGKHATITVTVTWEKVNRLPSTFELDAYAVDEDKVAVALAEPHGTAFVDADIRPTSPTTPQVSTIRKRADEFKAKRKAEIEAKVKAKQTPPKPAVVTHQSPPHPVLPAHPSFLHPIPPSAPTVVNHPHPPATPIPAHTPTPIPPHPIIPHVVNPPAPEELHHEEPAHQEG